MFTKNVIYSIAVIFLCSGINIYGQTLTIQNAANTASANYGIIKAKSKYAASAKAGLEQNRREYSPNLVLSAQQNYGTINGQNGPMYGFGGYGVASSGLPLNEQNWNAAFGALYLANINWDVFTFGRVNAKIRMAKASYEISENDLAQEIFQHQIKVISSYLNLLAAQRIVISQEKNLDRAETFRNTTVARALNGLIPGVDSSFANAEVSNAKILLTKATDMEQQLSNELSVLLGIAPQAFLLDSNFVRKIPQGLFTTAVGDSKNHPLLKLYGSRVKLNNEQTRFYRRSLYPTVSVFGIIQGRASGFDPGYTLDQTAFTRNYVTGISPTRANYLAGLGVNWNLSSILRNTSQIKAQKYVAEGIKEEYDLAEQQIKAQLALAQTKIKNALDNYREAPIQIQAASDAYRQKHALYKNGLATIVEVTQAMYTLNRAEIDKDIILVNVWQSLLLKASANGDINLFMKEIQ